MCYDEAIAFPNKKNNNNNNNNNNNKKKKKKKKMEILGYNAVPESYGKR